MFFAYENSAHKWNQLVCIKSMNVTSDDHIYYMNCVLISKSQQMQLHLETCVKKGNYLSLHGIKFSISDSYRFHLVIKNDDNRITEEVYVIHIHIQVEQCSNFPCLIML